MSNGPIEIIGGRERRRRWAAEEKLRIVAETHEPGASVRVVAARHDVYPNLLRTWRRQVREGRLVAAPPARFMPVRVAETTPMAAGIAPLNRDPAAGETVEIVLPDGLRVRVGNDVGLVALRRIMKVLRG
jgi:transposase